MKKIRPPLAGLAVLFLFLAPVQSADYLNKTGMSALAFSPFPVGQESLALPLEDNVAEQFCLEDPDYEAARITTELLPVDDIIERATEPVRSEPANSMKIIAEPIAIKKTASLSKNEPSGNNNDQPVRVTQSKPIARVTALNTEVEKTEIITVEPAETVSTTETVQTETEINKTPSPEVAATERTEKLSVVRDNKFINPSSFKAETGTENYSYFSIFERADQLKKYAQKNGFNQRYALIADMGMKSNKKRFFLVELQTFQILKSGLVAHGKGNEEFATDKKYSNEIGSKCTSLGVYKVGQSFEGEFGTAFKLYGLTRTNSNAYKRAIVLHSLNGIPDDEIDSPITQTEGCPSLSPGFLKALTPIIENNGKPILLWLFDSSTEQGLSVK